MAQKFYLRGTGTDTPRLFYKGTTLSYTELDNNFKGLANGGIGIYVDSVLSKNDVVAYSDERLKSNIKTIDNALEKVCSLRGVSFEKNNSPSIGVIAQEIEKVIPEVVQTNDDEMSTKAVAYGNLVGLLIEAIKEQEIKITSLENRLAAIEAKHDAP
jgi:hypothetical protein